MAESEQMKTLSYINGIHETPIVKVPLSKSVANRWLILRALFPDQIVLHEISDADDVKILKRALDKGEGDIDLGAAGTAMRFSLAYFSMKHKTVSRLFGSERMHLRPIGQLVDALCAIGAEITYQDKKGYPPVVVNGKHLRGGQVYVPADMSSQYISALMLSAPATQDGLVIHMSSKGVSQPYIRMTASVLEQAGINVEMDGNRIHVHGKVERRVDVPNEGDWSAAGAFLAWVAITGNPLKVQGLSLDSVQGDKILDELAPEFGVATSWENGLWCLKRTHIPTEELRLDLLDWPDLAQPLIMAAVGQGRSGHVSGLRTLRIKETDRIAALVETIEALGGETNPLAGAIYWEMNEIRVPDRVFKTFEDHRVAMSLAPMAYYGSINLEDPSVVSKSFPTFWDELKKLGLVLA